MNLTAKEYIHYSEVIRETFKYKRRIYMNIKELYLKPPPPPECTFKYKRILKFIVDRKKFILSLIQEEKEFKMSLIDLLKNHQAYLPPKVLKRFLSDVEKCIKEYFPEVYLAYIISDCDIILIMKRKSRV